MKAGQFLAVVIGIGIVPAALQSARAQSPANPVSSALPSLADWRSDLADIVRDIRTLHPEPYAKAGRLTFLRAVKQFEEELPSLTNQQRVTGLMRLVATIGDGHTYLEMNHPRYARWYPVRLYEFSDGFFILSAHKSASDLAGAQVLEIAGTPVAQVARNASAVMGYENAFMRAERVHPMHSETLMRGMGYADPDGRLALKLRLSNGRVVERTIEAKQADHPRFKDDATWEWQFRPDLYGTTIGTEEDWVTAYRNLTAAAFQTSDTTRPVFLTERRAFGARAIPEARSFYVRTNHISDTDFVPFFQDVLKQVDSLRPDKLIIDWRYNFGGDGSQVALLMREFIKRADNAPWKDIYVLTGRKTFSATVLALGKFMEFLPISLVGEPSAAGLNHFGDPTARTYSRTGLRLSVSTLRHQLAESNDLSEFIPVDVPAVFSFADFRAGRDPAVDRILRGDEMRSIPVIARRDGGAAARKAYQDRKRTFANVSWWRAPTEFAMRQACDALQKEKRFQDALETCRLTADMHPTTWNVWYNLAVAQRAAGLMKERLASYRCVVAIAPDNWNVPSIRRLLAQPGNEGNELAPGCPA
jgi:hypothetical protein